ncbi:MAG: 3-keto-5-aminohexanoate cleavage protein [Rhodospirillales bacterium]|nr:3-keto-5-aminohexanoate cleavage protein [Rhodospirillales bacterium]
MKTKIMITVAPVARVANPNNDVDNPLTPPQIARQTLACAKAGASQVHLHVRTEGGEMTSDTRVYSETLDLIRAQSNIVIQGSTGGFEKSLTLDERCSAIDDPRTDTASLNMGSINITFDTPFVNAGPEIEYWARRFKAQNVKPELEVFDTGQMAIIRDFMDRGLLESPLSINFPLGCYGGAPASVESILALRGLMPEGAEFGIAVNAMRDFRLIAASVAAGATKVRVGFEDSIFYAPGRKARDNVVLVEKLAELVRALGCEIMSIDEARGHLGLD